MRLKRKSCWTHGGGGAGTKRRRASALVIVLASLAFLAALALAFLASVGTELKSSKKYADGVSAQILSQSAFNLAIAQIVEGTRGTDNGGNVVAWASQPGMIRTYDTAGNKQAYYKLYSWDTMAGTGSFDPAAGSEAVSSTWFNTPALYVDLNEPLKLAGATHYPIVEGNGLKAVAGLPTGAKGYDADNNSVADIDGFYVGGAAPVAGTSGANPVPMPVKWLYVLEDGKLVAPSGATGTTATFSGPNAPSANNKIVGRVAFWTDDETCKININTASDGFSTQSGNSYTQTYWDAPKFSSLQDFNLANSQPAQHEYQRYPGHPAMIALSTVFPPPTGFTPQSWAEQIYGFIPRVVGGAGSSRGGTVGNAGALVLAPDADRLYASVDDFMFQPVLNAQTRVENSPSAVTSQALERAKFFITASSRAPDLNLFNKPRVCIWPVSQLTDASHRTAYDQLIAFCSTIGGADFYFKRSDALSASSDLPASGGAGLNRNRTLLTYLRNLTGTAIPGFGGGTFAAKYSTGNGSGTDRDQILTEIFDYIRSTNVADCTAGTQFNVKTGTYNAGAGEVVPIVDTLTNTRGFGRFPTVQGAALLFAGIGDNSTNAAIPAGLTQVQALFFVNLFLPSAGYPVYNPNMRYNVKGLENFTWQSWTSPSVSTEVPMGFPSVSTPGGVKVVPTTWSMWSVHGFGGTVDFIKFATGQVDWFSAPNQGYKLRSSKVYMPTQTSPSSPSQWFTFHGGNVTIELLAPDGTTVVQTVVLNFPDGTSAGTDGRFPVPMLASNNVGGYNFRNLTSPYGSTPRLTGNSSVGWIVSGDVVRSVVPKTGDLRLAVPHPSINPSDASYGSLYAPHAWYGDKTKMLAHNLRNEDNQPYYGATTGRLLNLDLQGCATTRITYTANNPYLTNEAGRDSSVAYFGAGEIIGDWDNGFAGVPDAPFINKADEGTNGTAGGYTPYYGYSGGGIGTTLFSPNRMVPSAGMFGSLPSEVLANKAWQTLLFCPNPLQGATHKGFSSPPDHLLLDLFHMPVVEPYAISEPLSTAGRINMNYQILPFTYLNRDTGIRAILKTEKVIGVPDSASTGYKKLYTTSAGASPAAFRLDINADETLKGFSQRFASNDLFRSPSEICGLYLVPQGAAFSSMAAYWANKRLTGDNSRERPYTTIYPRLTTKSNTFTIHVRVQSLQKNEASSPAAWDESKDVVTGEYRGFQTIERYADPNARNFPDYADPLVSTPISSFYKTRILASKQFAP